MKGLKMRPLRVEQLEDRTLPSAAFVLEWNELLVDIQADRLQGNQQSARALAMMNASIYDAVNAINPTHTIFHTDASVVPGVSDVSTASPDAAAAQAAHDVAYALYTRDGERTRIDDLLKTQLDSFDDGQAELDGIEVGKFVAAGMVAWRTGDGSSATVPYVYGSGPGVYQATPPNSSTATPATPQWPFVTPFALESGDQFRAGPPPALTSAAYTAAYQEVKAIGGDGITTPSTRTPEQTEIALFWAGLGVSNSGVGIWSQITQTVSEEHHLNLAENARLFAQVAVANADAFIASFDIKYTYNFWRPITAIRAGDTDGNPTTTQDSTWTPLFATPFHPSYGSNHSSQSRAAAESLAAFFGTDRVKFSATWDTTTRSFNKFTEAAKEAGKSRVFAGIHWSFDCAIGENLGRKIGQYVADHYFLPLAETGGGESRAVVHSKVKESSSGKAAKSITAPQMFLAPAMSSAPSFAALPPSLEGPDSIVVTPTVPDVPSAPAEEGFASDLTLRAEEVAPSDPFADGWGGMPWSGA